MSKRPSKEDLIEALQTCRICGKEGTLKLEHPNLCDDCYEKEQRRLKQIFKEM